MVSRCPFSIERTGKVGFVWVAEAAEEAPEVLGAEVPVAAGAVSAVGLPIAAGLPAVFHREAPSGVRIIIIVMAVRADIARCSIIVGDRRR